MGLGLANSAFSSPGLPTLKSLGPIRFSVRTACVCKVGFCHWAEADQDVGMSGCRGQGESCSGGQQGNRRRIKGCESIWGGFSTQTNKDPAEESKWRSSEKVSKQRLFHLPSLQLLCQGCGNKKEEQVRGQGKGFPASTGAWLRHEKRQEGTSSFTETFASSSQGDAASLSSHFSAGGQRIKVGLK